MHWSEGKRSLQSPTDIVERLFFHPSSASQRTAAFWTRCADDISPDYCFLSRYRRRCFVWVRIATPSCYCSISVPSIYEKRIFIFVPLTICVQLASIKRTPGPPSPLNFSCTLLPCWAELHSVKTQRCFHTYYSLIRAKMTGTKQPDLGGSKRTMVWFASGVKAVFFFF